MTASTQIVSTASVEHRSWSHSAGEATARRERNSTLVATAPGVLVHRIGDDDPKPDHFGPKQRYEHGRQRAAHAPKQDKPATSSYHGEIAEARTHRPRPESQYSLPQSLRMASQRAREVQPPLINMAGADLS
jgi:hypothetical protein